MQMFKYLFKCHSRKAEKFGILYTEYCGIPRNFFCEIPQNSVKLFLSEFRGIPRILTAIPTNVRKFGNKTISAEFCTEFRAHPTVILMSASTFQSLESESRQMLVR